MTDFRDKPSYEHNEDDYDDSVTGNNGLGLMRWILGSAVVTCCLVLLWVAG